MCVNSSHHQHCETKPSKLLALDKLLFCSVVFVHVVKSPIHHGNQASHFYSQCKHMVCHSAPRQSIPPVTTTAAMGSGLCLILFNIFINERDDGTVCILSKFAEGARLGGMTDRPQGCHRPGEEEEMGSQEFHEVQQVEVQSSAIGEELPQAPAHAGTTHLESSFAERDLGTEG